jgi:hypothetical protein
MIGWNRVWNLLKEKYGSFECAHPDTGETFQYMGTYGGLHEFRHRCLPATNSRELFYIPIFENDFSPIEKGNDK